MRGPIAVALGIAIIAGGATAWGAIGDPSSVRVREAGKQVTALEKKVTRVAARRGPRGRAGAAGPTGDRGPIGSAGATGEVGDPAVFSDGTFVPTGSIATTDTTVVSLQVTSAFGRTFFLRGNATLVNAAAQTATVQCRMSIISYGNLQDTATVKLGATGALDTRSVSLFETFNTGAFATFTERIVCSASGVPDGSVSFEDADLTATEVDREVPG